MQTKEMPIGMRVVFTVLFSMLTLFLAALVIDGVSSKVVLDSSAAETTGILDSKNQTHGKDGYAYYFTYHFVVHNVEYRRKWFFGLLNKSTQVQLNTYNSHEIGSEISIAYSKINPNISTTKDVSNERSYLLWQFLGILVFGAIAINEIRAFIKRRKVSKSARSCG
jgi:hypothetical protein